MDFCKLSKIFCGVVSSIICLVLGIGLFSLLFGYQGAKPSTPCADSFGTVTYLHRGNLSFAQENTFDAVVTGSAALGSNSEIDIRSTKEGDTVLFHDDSLKRMAGIEKDLKDASKEELLNVTLSSEIDGYNYNKTNFITELLPVVKAICEETDTGINFDVKNTGAVDAVVTSIKESECSDTDDHILTTAFPDIAKESRQKLDDAGLRNIRVGLYMPKPNERHYFSLGQKFMLKTRLLHSLLSGSGSSIIEFHKSTYDSEKEMIKGWQDDGWCVGIYGIRPEEVDNYPGLNIYIVDEGPVFPDMGAYGGYGADDPAKEIIYKNGLDNSLKWYYGLIAIAAVLLVIECMSTYLIIRTCRSDSKKEENDDYAKAEEIEVKNDTTGTKAQNDDADPEFGVVVH